MIEKDKLFFFHTGSSVLVDHKERFIQSFNNKCNLFYVLELSKVGSALILIFAWRS